MKIVISSQGPDLNSPCDPRFGRCAFFIFYDLEKDEYESVENPFAGAYGGAGIQAAQFVIQKGVNAVISGSVGPNAFGVLESAGIQVFMIQGGTVKEAIEAFKRGELPPLAGPGMGGFGPGRGFGPGMGGGFGRGMGRGMGGGRGIFGAGMSGSPYYPPPFSPSPPSPPPQPSEMSELDYLKERAKELEEELKWIKKRIEEIERGK